MTDRLIDQHLEHLKCPISGEPLHWGDRELLNFHFGEEGLGVVNKSRQYLFPVVDGLLSLHKEDVILLRTGDAD